MSAAPTRKPAADEKADNSSGFTIQIGPNVTGNAFGYFFAPSSTFYVSLGSGTPDQTYVWYNDASGNWQQVPNNQTVTASASPNGSVYFYYTAAGSSTGYKFLMGP
jgi:hypothetical protein